jgi:hypothetical protein
LGEGGRKDLGIHPTLRAEEESGPSSFLVGRVVVSNETRDRLRSQINAMRPTIEAIAAEVDAALLVEIREGLDYTNSSPIGPCERLLARIESREEIASIVGPQAPQLSASELHRWVWKEAAPRWQYGFYRDAVQTRH